MDLALFTQWAGAIGLGLSIINMGWNLAGRAGKPFTDKLKAVEDKQLQYRADLIDHDRRIQTLEDGAKHTPTSEQVTGLLLSIERLDGHIKRLDESTSGLTHTVRRMDDFLRKDRA